MLHWIDWLLIFGFMAVSLGIGLYYRKEGSRSLGDFFLGGRNLPWYIAGLSMVATTFAADTPLAVAELVAQGGVAKNWLWWSFVFGGGLTTFFFASLWRRSGVLTELEFITLRYEGPAALWLRKVKAVYIGFFINAIIIGWVNVAMASILEVFFGLSTFTSIAATLGLMVLASAYSALSGLKGVAITDAFQFVVAMVGCIVLAVLVINSEQVGGVASLKERLPAGSTDFFPRLSGEGLSHGFGLSIGAFLSFVAVQWWASWYPGAEPGGGGYVVQRMLSVRTERDSVWATLFFQIGHYCIRPWPWIVVGLCAVVLYSPQVNNPELSEKLSTFSKPFETSAAQSEVPNSELSRTGAQSADEFFSLFPSHRAEPLASQVAYHYSPRLGFVFAMRDFLPVGLRGLLLVAFIAAYLSTISTQVNWGASYLVNDLWLLINPTDNQRLLVHRSRLMSVAVMMAAAEATPFITNISAVWAFLMNCGAGLGLVLILRWYWWRVNAWSEIAATVAPVLAYAFCHFYLSEAIGPAFDLHNGSLWVTVAFTTVVWLSVASFSAPASDGHLKQFTQAVKPAGWWPHRLYDSAAANAELKWKALAWLAMTAGILLGLFAIGNAVLAQWVGALSNAAGAAFAVFALRHFLRKTNIFDRNSETPE